MIPRECKRLAEVDFPIAQVGAHSVREKTILRHHPQAIHQWWARRPLASCRAMIMTLLLPDPCDPSCPHDFKAESRALLSAVRGTVGEEDLDLQKALFQFIADFANWDLASNIHYVRVARGLVELAYQGAPPMVVDPFAGGGSIPLEALRVGCDAFASDLNPVACLILKVLLEYAPRHGRELASEFRRVSREIRARAEEDLKEFYPTVDDADRPIAYLWARVVRCESPKCGAEIPLLRSFWLSKNPARKRALRYKVSRTPGKPPQVGFEIFTPHTDSAVPSGTVSRAKATCPACGTVLHPDRVRAQLKELKGGADVVFDNDGNRTGGALLLAVVSLRNGRSGRVFRLATAKDYEAVRNVQARLKVVTSDLLPGGLSKVPDEAVPLMSGTFNVPLYGMSRWGDLLNARQKLFLTSLTTGFAAFNGEFQAALKEPVSTLWALVVSRAVDRHATLVGWDSGREHIDHVFKRQALPMTWDYAEGVPFADASGSIENIIEQLAGTLERWADIQAKSGQTELADAADHPLPGESSDVWFTDPPYYFAVPYADLSDFFFVWLKRTIPDHPLLHDPFDEANTLTPKEREICQMAYWDKERYAYKDQAFFEEGMQHAFREGRRELASDGIGCVVFAHKTTEAWEALLSGLITGGWVVTASWPILTERPTRFRAYSSAALASSVHLVCRPRDDETTVGDWAVVLKELPGRVAECMTRLQREGVRGADLVFACIGPALEIYSKYERVETAEGREVELAEFLERVWEVVGKSALAQVLGDGNGTTVLEEDARLTALFLWTLQTTKRENGDEAEDEEESGPIKGGFSLIYDVVRRFAQPLGIHLPEWENRIIKIEKGVVRLLPVADRAKQLFGREGVAVAAAGLTGRRGKVPQLGLFPDREEENTSLGRGKKVKVDISGDTSAAQREATTLDRVHAAMLLQRGGQANALRTLLKQEAERGPDFLRLANALAALYPRGSEELRLLEALLVAAPK